MKSIERQYQDEIDELKAKLTLAQNMIIRMDDRVCYIQEEANALLRILRSADMKRVLE
jgi:hypothetical protein